MNALWAIDEMVKAMGAQRVGTLPAAISGISIDSRDIARGEAFFAIQGENRDGHDFVEDAIKAGAALAVVARAKCERFASEIPLLIVDDVLEALCSLAREARGRMAGKVIAVTGSVGKTSTKEALRLALSADGETHASAASHNNHWGVPLSLARCPAHVNYAIFEIGMNHAGEITPLVALVRPHIAIITTIEPVHLQYLGSLEKIADAKAEIFSGLVSGGGAVLNRDNAHYERLAAAAGAAGVTRIVTFGEHEEAEARLIRCVLQRDGSVVDAIVLDQPVTYKLGAPGRHFVLNSLAVLAAVSLAGADLALAALALRHLQPAAGRGTRSTLDLPDGGSALLIDESYNANPASMRAAIALLSQGTAGPPGRRIAVLGDMLELGDQGASLHRDLREPILEGGIDLVYCSGPLMNALWKTLPSHLHGGYAETSAVLEPLIVDAIRAGDTVMVKGSLGSKMGLIVESLRRRFSRRMSSSTHFVKV